MAKFTGKACLPCASAKRRCDKSLPACRRCVDRTIRCHYPAIRPYARCPREVRDAAVADASLDTRRFPSQEAPPTRLAEIDTGAVQDGGCAFLAAEAAVTECRTTPLIQLSGASFPSESADVDNLFRNGNGSLTCAPINPSAGCNFDGAVSLATPSWLGQSMSTDSIDFEVCPSATMQWVDPDQSRPVRASVHKEFIKTVGIWVRGWARNGHCPFIHSELYADTGTPNCLQDAFACLAAYEMKTDRTEEMAWQLVERTATELFRQKASESGDRSPLPDSSPRVIETLELSETLALIQSGFLITYIRLFDGDIRQRSLAEAHMDTLLSWLKKLTVKADLFSPRLTFAAGKRHRVVDQTTPSSTNVAHQWRDWILAESVRRTWIVTVYTLSVFCALRGDQVRCSGKIAFTMRAGLWEAQSASAWARIVATRDALFTEPLSPDLMEGVAAAGEVDVFVKPVVSIM
ncbi:hypothetical protein NLG97_g2354 [Lecanicillium saksenae]|uniref:Uncharacterized protein n=1 Tax=Lecanicillium saksenae TaxID=468837 RepID=A0ACC1R1T1_9HYPO|nr:hypothetical protein NLG97_g2354 [Lecanicillium saksenae]